MNGHDSDVRHEGAEWRSRGDAVAAVRRRSIGMRAAVLVCLAACGGCGKTYERRNTVVLTAGPPAEMLQLDNYVGDVVIRADRRAEGVRAEVMLIGRGPTQKEADESLQAMSV